MHYQSAFDMAKALPASEQGARYQIRAVLKLANVASNRKQFERDLNNLELARSLAADIDHQFRLCQSPSTCSYCYRPSMRESYRHGTVNDRTYRASLAGHRRAMHPQSCTPASTLRWES